VRRRVALKHHNAVTKFLIRTSSVSYFPCIGDNAKARRERVIGKATRLAESAGWGKRKRRAHRLRRIKQHADRLGHCVFNALRNVSVNDFLLLWYTPAV
jgi:hypothetical protein